MKLIIRSYLESLKEREELDAILPDLLSELGFTVYSRPGRGTTQYGVDVAAVGKDKDGERKVFLFTIKPNNLTRTDWHSTPQSVCPSLDEIRLAYIPSRIPKHYEDLKIVICLCIGGEMREQVLPLWAGYTKINETDKISFDLWNGDTLAGLLEQGILREGILPKHLRSSFQKAVALVDEPDVAYAHFSDMVNQMREKAGASQKETITAARQIYICLWIMFVWARDIDNLDAPYRASELAILNVWHMQRPFIGKKTKNARAITAVLNQLIRLHLTIAGEFLEGKIFPHIEKTHALSVAVESQSSVDVNLKLFDLLGRIAMTGLWLYWLGQKEDGKVTKETKEGIAKLINNGFKLIQTNPMLYSPLCDQHAIEISLFLQISLTNPTSRSNILHWLTEMVGRLDLAIRSHGKYPCVFTNYSDLIQHPKDNSEVYRKDATVGSILIPLIAAWLGSMNVQESLKTLVKLQKKELNHCTLQLWLPDSETEDNIYIGGRGHGIALTDLILSETGKELLDIIAETCQSKTEYEKLSAIQTGYWPIILLACRHYRHPVPPQFWIDSLLPPNNKPQKTKT